jgi:hypothetical protein
MNWEAIGAISETVGAITVVVSVVYLAVQIRQGTQSIQSSTHQSNTGLFSSMFSELADPEISAAYAVGLAGDPNIKPRQYTQFFLICRGLFIAFENQYFQYRQGMLDADTYLGYERSICQQLLAFRGFRIWWKQSRDVFSTQYAEYVDQLIERTPECEPNHMLDEWKRLATEH